MQVDELVAKLEAATAGSTELDRLVGREAIWPNWRAVVGPGSEVETGDRGFVRDARAADYLPAMPKPYTTSLDAALTLLLQDHFWRVGHDGEGQNPADFLAIVMHETSQPQRARHASPALAICIAALKARSAT